MRRPTPKMRLGSGHGPATPAGCSAWRPSSIAIHQTCGRAAPPFAIIPRRGQRVTPNSMPLPKSRPRPRAIGRRRLPTVAYRSSVGSERLPDWLRRDLPSVHRRERLWRVAGGHQGTVATTHTPPLSIPPNNPTTGQSPFPTRTAAAVTMGM